MLSADGDDERAGADLCGGQLMESESAAVRAGGFGDGLALRCARLKFGCDGLAGSAAAWVGSSGRIRCGVCCWTDAAGVTSPVGAAGAIMQRAEREELI